MPQSTSHHQVPEAIRGIPFEELIVGLGQSGGQQQPWPELVRFFLLPLLQRWDLDGIAAWQSGSGGFLPSHEYRFKFGDRFVGCFL